MQMSDAVEVVQVAGASAANEKLAEGWKLLAVVPNANSEGRSHVAYVLGKPKPPAEAKGKYVDGDWAPDGA